MSDPLPGQIVLTRAVGRGVVIMDAHGREIARVTVARLEGGRVRLAMALAEDLSAARDEVAAQWRPRLLKGA